MIGEPFFRNFYAVFDDSKGVVGLAPSINFLHAGIIEGVVPNDELPFSHPIDQAKIVDEQEQQKLEKPKTFL